jgi:hypothetical protein
MILGPWSGQLQNSGEKIRLLKPNPNPPASDTTGQPSEVLVDEVDYANTAPWPANANATGYSLQRVFSGAYGNDPANWAGAFATPAQPNAPPNVDATGDNGASGDPDHDGFTNLQEYLSGTAPRSAASHLQIDAITYSATGLQLTFTAAAARSYSVLASADASSATWSKLLDIPASPASKDVVVTVGNPATHDFPQRFYRIVTPLQP